MMEQPTTITAVEWSKIAPYLAEGKCIVWRTPSKEERIISIRRSGLDNSPIEIIRTNDGHLYESSGIDELRYNVEWMDTAPASEPEAGDAPSVNVFAAYVGELEATVASLQAERDEMARKLAAAVSIEEMSSTLLPDGHEVKGLGCFIEHEGQKLLFFESSVVSDLQHELSLAKDRIAVLEQSEQMLLKRIKKLKKKSALDDGFIDYLTANDKDSQW